MNLGEKAALIAGVIALIVFTFTYLLARSRKSKRAEEAVAAFTVRAEEVIDTNGQRIVPTFLMTEEGYRVAGVASGRDVSAITLDANGVRHTNRYVDERAYHADLATLTGAMAVPALDLHIGFQPDGQRALFVMLSQEWSPLLLGQGDRMDEAGRDFVAETLCSRLPDDGSEKRPAARLGAFVASVENAYGAEIEADETLAGERDQMKALLAMAGEGEVILASKTGFMALLSRIGARSLHRRAEDGLTEINLT